MSILKIITIKEYKENIEILEKIIEIISLKDSSEIKILNEIKMLNYFLKELVERFKKLTKELENDEKIGYYELVRSTYEFSLIILFILYDKKLIYNKLVCYDYVLNYCAKENLRNLLKSEELLKELNEKFNNDIFKVLDEQIIIIKSIFEIENMLNNSNYSMVKQEFEKYCKEQKYPKFYHCYCNGKIKNIKSLAEYIDKFQSYETLYNVTSAISHGENLRLREDISLIRTGTFEFNFIVCEIVRKLGLYYCNIAESHNWEERIKSKLGKNYPKFFERLNNTKKP